MLEHTFDIVTIPESKLKSEPSVKLKFLDIKTPISTKTEAEKGGYIDIYC